MREAGLPNPICPRKQVFVQAAGEYTLTYVGVPPISIKQAHSARLEGYFYTRLPLHHPLRPELKRAYLAQELRHQQIKAWLLPLLGAWKNMGIETLLFKGFALAEFVYPRPGMRFYGDVDVLVRPAQAEAAAEIAQRLGWQERWSRHDTVIHFSHEASHLYTPDGLVRLDLHLEVLQRPGPGLDRRQRFTQAVWDSSELQPMGDAVIRLMQPLDALLVGLLLNRGWNDQWGAKPHDLADAQALVEKFGLTRTDLKRRALELGCPRTLELLLPRCDPWEGRGTVGLPPVFQRLVWELRTVGELGSWTLERWFGRLSRLPGLLSDVLHELPGVVRMQRVLRDGQNLPETFSRLERPIKLYPDGSGRRLEEVVRGVRWLLGRRKNGCVPRALATYVALRAEGRNVAFVSGVRRVQGKLEGHAWVELDGLPLLGDEESPSLYQETFRHPPRPGTGA